MLEPGLNVTGHRVKDFDRIGSGHGSKVQTRFHLWAAVHLGGGQCAGGLLFDVDVGGRVCRTAAKSGAR